MSGPGQQQTIVNKVINKWRTHPVASMHVKDHQFDHLV